MQSFKDTKPSKGAKVVGGVVTAALVVGIAVGAVSCSNRAVDAAVDTSVQIMCATYLGQAQAHEPLPDGWRDTLPKCNQETIDYVLSATGETL